MRTRIHVISLVICLLTAIAAPPALGQQEAGEPLINLDFKGGTAVDYIEAIRDAVDDVNIIVEEGVEQLPIGPVQLKRAPLSSALRYLDNRRIELPDHIIQLDVREFPPRRDGEVVYAVSAEKVAHRLAQRTQPQTSEPISHVWTVADILGSNMPAEDVLTTVETALMLFGDQYDPAQIRFHEETQLLIARGHPEQMELIDRVIDELRETVAYQRNQARREQNERSASERAGKLKVELDAANANAAGLERKLIEARTRNDVLQQELQRAQDTHEAMISNLREQLAERDRRVAALEQTVAQLQAEIKRIKGSNPR
jgi:hypothetical protein